MKRFELFTLLATEDMAIDWGITKGLLNADPTCPKCGNNTRFYPKMFYYRCQNRECQKVISLTVNTIFSSIKLPISKGIYLLYEWSSETASNQVSFQYDISLTTVNRWYKKFRGLASFFNLIESDLSIGGPGLIVEIDESLLCKRKYNRGRILGAQVWVFGGITRGNPLECFMEVISNRRRNTLVSIIDRRVRSGSTISSDSWKAYSNIDQLLPHHDFEEHKVVNHSRNFVNPDDSEAHTQNIEAFWSAFKRKMRKKAPISFNSKTIETHFGEFQFRKRHKDLCFQQMLDKINEFY